MTKQLKIKLAMFTPDGRDDRPWRWSVRFWAFLWRWTGKGFPWIRGWQTCGFCGIDADDAEYGFERIGHGKLACTPDYDCFEDRLLASIPAFRSDRWAEVSDVRAATRLEVRGLVTPLLAANNRLVYQRTRAGDLATTSKNGTPNQ